ncbi:MAG: glycosyltransferase family 4 protein [Sphingomonadales bacterium]|nr:glycosyltransferase family 4 protein [Sphingomonadales bacterium]MBM3923308.1 glycosyltransferase family 4 protein [Sphingomonadales bacterium]
MFRLGFDAKRAFHNRTGLGNYARTFLQNLAHFYPENEYHLFSPALKSHANRQHSDNPLFTTPFHFHPIQSPLASWKRSFQMRGPLLSNRIQVYHGLSNEIPLDLKRLQGRVRSVLTVHDLIFLDLPSTYSWIDCRVYRYKTKRSLALADRVVAISEATRRQLLQHFPEDEHKIQVILQPCSPEYYANSPKSSPHPLADQAYWLWVGTVEQRKNLETVLHALRLTPADERLPLVVIGNTSHPYAQQCVQLAASLGVKVHWNPHRHPDLGKPADEKANLIAWYRHAQGLVYPSHLEGFGLPVAEALLSRCPVITTRNSSMAEICGPHGLLVDSTQPEELQAAMASLRNDSAMGEALRNEGQSRALSLLDPRRITGQWMNLYRELIGG